MVDVPILFKVLPIPKFLRVSSFTTNTIRLLFKRALRESLVQRSLGASMKPIVTMQAIGGSGVLPLHRILFNKAETSLINRENEHQDGVEGLNHPCSRNQRAKASAPKGSIYIVTLASRIYPAMVQRSSLG